MKTKNILITIFLFILIVATIRVILLNRDTEKQGRVCFKDKCFNVELAIEPSEQSQGLMFREHLDSDKGMLFIYDKEGKYPFWMKNTLIPLDIIWINGSREVVFISEDTQPCKESFCSVINPGKNAKYVLEINGGISREIGLIVGDKISLEIR